MNLDQNLSKALMVIESHLGMSIGVDSERSIRIEPAGIQGKLAAKFDVIINTLKLNNPDDPNYDDGLLKLIHKQWNKIYGIEGSQSPFGPDENMYSLTGYDKSGQTEQLGTIIVTGGEINFRKARLDDIQKAKLVKAAGRGLI